MVFSDLATGGAQTLPFTLAVGNGGFETGDFSDWVFIGTTNADYVASPPDYTPYVHSGGFAGVFGEPAKLASLSQLVPSVPGQSYLISFWLDNPVRGGSNQFQFNWNGTTLYSHTNFPVFQWTNLVFQVNATQSTTPLQFLFKNPPDAFGFDDVNVTPVAPLAFSSVTVSNGWVAFAWSAVPGLGYQLQYATNLPAPAWINLGSLVIATNRVAAARDAVPAGLQQYYRVLPALP
jgi:hypothetical protein